MFALRAPAACLLALASLAAFGQGYPAKPIRVIVPFAAGGSIDFTIRTFSDRFLEITGQPLVLDNRGGGSGILAAEAFMRMPADGYSVMAATIGQMSLNPHTFAQLPYDPQKSFVAVTQLVTTNMVWVVSPAAAPVGTLKEYLAWAKANPDRASFASTGVGTPQHFGGAMLAQAGGVELLHVPYKGAAPQMADLISGRVSGAMATSVVIKDFVRDGKLRVLAAATEKRLAHLPDVPTFRELGYAEVLTPLWSGLLAPAGTPSAIVEALSGAVAKALSHPDVREKFAALDQEVVGGTPAQFAEFMRADRERWGRAVRASGFKP